jgi:branched-chain amino acid transport system ATP-binding protein
MMTAVPKNVVLELASLNKFFGGVHAVRDMTFTIKKGELAGLIGPNGAGKTTIFNLVTGVYEPDSGHINFLGEDITSLKTYEVIRKGIARTFQNLRLFPRSTALENIMVAMQQHHGYSFAEAFTHLGRWGKREREIHLNSMDILDRVGLVDRADQAGDSKGPGPGTGISSSG